ncbi:MAG: PAS domain-containing protein [Deltaproteobacteria bacterium]|nr:PAS domain-containing protein [Deltaproteobacteria bacterium]
MPAADSSRTLRAARDRTEDVRKITYLMLFRVGLVTVLLAAIVLISASGPSPEELARPYSLFVLGLIAVTYGLTLVYAWLLQRVTQPQGLAYAQIGADLAITTALVHATGGAESAFTFLYLLSIIGAGMVLTPRGSLGAAAAAAVLYLTAGILGHAGLLPPVYGQRVLPTASSAQELGRAVAINLSAMGAVALLAANLASQVRRVGERLADQQDRYSDLAAQGEDIIRCLTSGLVTVDRGRRVTSFNQAAAEITGIARERALGQPLATLLPGLGDLGATIPGSDRLEIDITRPDGTHVPVGVSVSALTNRVRAEVGRIYNFQSLSELKRMEQQVKRSERMAAVGQLAATMAHEIRNPLASISGSIELLRGGARDEEDRKLMAIVLREVARLNRLIGELLDFARPRQPTRSRLDLGAPVRDALAVFGHERREELTVEVETEGPVWVEADATQAQQLVWNLLKNASEAMPSGGLIRVTLSVERGGAAATAVLRVTDHGKGVPPDLRERIFEPFFSTKTHGTGLGLAMVQRIVQDHGGTVEVVGDGAEGATFEVRLPAVP